MLYYSFSHMITIAMLVVAAVHAAVPSPPLALPSAPAAVLVLVLDDSAIGDANGALEQERFWVMAPPPPAPFRFPCPSCSRMVAACEFACRIHRRQTPGSLVSCMSASWPASKIRSSESLRRLSCYRWSAAQKSARALPIFCLVLWL